jgi:hypothetical protein
MDMQKAKAPAIARPDGLSRRLAHFRNSMRWRKSAKLFIRALTIKKNWNTE